ncbi:UDP-N-acetylmuramate dehydrogenase [Candidatus Poribacteria bacterium]|nr:UDP-N-acetylmuramate dehydrogenase [Candidatus Poribacteria bacterium]
MTWQDELQAITGKVKYNEPLSKHTSFSIGGPALALVEAKSIDELKSLLSFRERFNLPVMVIGRGTNILVSDAGYNGIIVVLSTPLLPPRVWGDGTQVTAGAGITLTRLAKQLAESSLSGLEFAYGIPGTLGGALIMNAGAHGYSMSEIVTEIQVMTHKGEVLTISKEQAGFDYRKSNLNQYFCIIKATLQLKMESQEKIAAEMKKLYNERKSKQPLSLPSAGCVFKNPPPSALGQAGASAGKLIDECGLKGTKIGGAEVSQKHANFIVNTSGATAADVLALIDLVRKQVKSKTGIDLELEIQVMSNE